VGRVAHVGLEARAPPITMSTRQTPDFERRRRVTSLSDLAQQPGLAGELSYEVHGALPRSLDPPSSEYQGQPFQKSLFSRLHTNGEKVPQNGLLLLGGGVDITMLASHFLSFSGRCGCKGRPPTNLPGLSRSNEATKMGRIYRWPCFPTRVLGHSLLNLTTAAVTILSALCQIRMRRHNMNNAAACCLPGRVPG
jgi:hypothetical protein